MSDAAFYTCGYNTEFVQQVWEKRRKQNEASRAARRKQEEREKIAKRRAADARRQRERRARLRRIKEKKTAHVKIQKRIEAAAEAHNMRDVIRKWEKIYGLEHGTLASEIRKKLVVECRQQAIAECYTSFPDKSLNQIGRMFERDHTTVLHSVKKMGVYDPDRGAKFRGEKGA